MKRALPLVCLASLLAGSGCGGDEAAPTPEEQNALANRAYVVSRDHGDLTVFDLGRQEIIARVATGGVANHMAELSADFSKVYVTSSDTNELIVVDARTLTVGKRLPLAGHPTHLTAVPGQNLLAVMVEDDNAVAFVDSQTDTVKKVLPGFYTPHFMRFSADRSTGYVANIGAHHVTEVDLRTLEIKSHIALSGREGGVVLARDEGGFADAQIDRDGRLYAAHNDTGIVLVYDTVARRKLPDLHVGIRPWVVFAEHPFDNVPLRHLVPSFEDKTVALIDGKAGTVAAMLPGDEEAYGVNFSSRAPGRAFVMNRLRKDVAVVDTDQGTIAARIDVGGNTETASTTADGRYIVAAVSGANRVVFIDPETAQIAKSFDGIGTYPWSVTIPNGQNYCH